MKCKSCKQTIEAALAKKNNGQCPLCKKPAGKKYRFPASPRQKGKTKRTIQESMVINSMTCDFTGGKFNRDGFCSRIQSNSSGATCRRCLK
jgi:hypothetical protein